MSIIVNSETRLLVQGITGKEGGYHAVKCQEYGTNLVAGVTPGKGGQIINGNIPKRVLGIIIKDRPTGIQIFTSNFLKKFISSNMFIIKPIATKTKITFKKLFKNSLIRYLFNTKFFIIFFYSFQT